MNTTLNQKLFKRATDPLRQFAAGLMVSAMLMLHLTPAWALDVQTLNDTVAGQSGFTHAAQITWDDLNATDQSAVVIQLMNIPTNSYVDRVAFIVSEAFTNASYVDAGSNLVMTVGVGGTTNFFFGSNVLIHARSVGLTNILIPHKSATSTNYLIACFSDGSQASLVDNYLVGKVRIYWRLVQPTRWRF